MIPPKGGGGARGFDVAPVLALHRDRESYIHMIWEPGAGSSIDLGGKRPVDGPGIRYGFLRPPAEGEGWLPGLLPQLDRQAFFSLSGYAKAARAEAWNLRRLNAAWVDCDTELLDFGESMNALIHLEDAGVLPLASAFVRTGGRGAWALWLLEERDGDDAGLPPSARQGNRTLHRRVQRAIAERVKEHSPLLMPDLQALDATRHVRVPGTAHAEGGERCYYLFRADAQGQRIAYALDDLADLLMVPRRAPYRRRDGRPAKAGGGHVAAAERYAHEWERIAEHRGKFLEGRPSRHGAVYVLAYALARRGATLAEVEAECIAAGRDYCSPRLGKGDCRALARSVHGYVAGHRGRWPRNRTLAEKLGVTVEEAEELGLESIRPDFERAEAAGATKGRRAAREAAIRAHLDGATVCNGAELVRALRAAGHKFCKQTLYNHLADMGVETIGAAVEVEKPLPLF